MMFLVQFFKTNNFLSKLNSKSRKAKTNKTQIYKKIKNKKLLSFLNNLELKSDRINYKFN